MKNDFAARLLGRATAPAVRPLLPSLFEPAAPPAAEWAAPMGAVTETAAPTAFEHPESPQTSVQSVLSEVNPVARPSVAPVREYETPLPAAPTPVVSYPAEVRTAEASPTVVGPDRQPRPGQVPKPAPASAPGSASIAIPVLPTSSVGHPVAMPSAETYRPEDPAHHADPVSAATSHDLPVHHARPAHPAEAVTRRDRPVRPAAPPAQPATRRSARMAAEPTVHISIGRVEVKATTEPVVTKRAEQPKRPVLSLDDYLRGRTGGGRK